MNELKQIRTMAELILEKVSALEGVRPKVKVEPKFAVGDRVQTSTWAVDDIDGKIADVRHTPTGFVYDVEDDRYGFFLDRREDSLFKALPKFKVGDRVRQIHNPN